MTGRRKSLLVAALHVAIVASVGAKFAVDRATLPRVWVRTAPVDPDLPVRGRYVQLRLEVTATQPVLDQFLPPGSDGQPPASSGMTVPVELQVHDGELVAAAAPLGSPMRLLLVEREGRRVTVLERPVAYFIPEHVPDPSSVSPGEELWVEVSVPREGAPRPTRLGLMRDGQLTPR
jgi:hypothetical protein